MVHIPFFADFLFKCVFENFYLLRHVTSFQNLFLLVSIKNFYAFVIFWAIEKWLIGSYVAIPICRCLFIFFHNVRHVVKKRTSIMLTRTGSNAISILLNNDVKIAVSLLTFVNWKASISGLHQRRAPRARWRPRRPRFNVKFGFFFGGRA